MMRSSCSRTGSLSFGMALGLAFTVGGVNHAQADLIVVPNALAAVEGNNASEFLTGDPRADSIRYQQVFGASQFAEMGLITEIAFRPDAVRGTAFSGTLSNVRISLSTTLKSPDGLSSAFDDNLGMDESVVFDSDLAISSADVAGPGGTRAFDIVIALSSPFLYDPNLGNLLLDFQRDLSSLAPLGVSFDAHEVTGDAISRVYGSRGSAVGEFGVDSAGVVTQFTIIDPPAPVPEPSSLILVGTGVASLYAFRRRRRRCNPPREI